MASLLEAFAPVVAPFVRWFQAAPPTADAPMGEVAYVDPYTLFGGRPTPYNPNALLSRQGFGIVDEMRRDDQVKAALAFKKKAVLASGWDVKSPEGEDDDWEVTEFVEEVLNGVSGRFNARLIEMMSSLDFGFSFTEKVWVSRDGDVVLDKLATRRPNAIEFYCDVYGNLQEVRQNQRILTPLNKFIIWPYDFEFSNYYGRTDLEAAHRAWWTKKNAYKWMSILLERAGIPPIFAFYNQNVYKTGELNQLKDVLRAMQAATVGTIPRPTKDDLEMWAPELAGQVAQVFMPAMELFNKDIARGLLMPGLLGMTDDQTQGSLARSEVHFDVFMLVLEDIRAELQDIVQEQIVEPVVMYNFGAVEDMPKFQFLPISDDIRLDLMKSWAELIGAKVVLPTKEDEAHIRSTLKFPERDAQDDDYPPTPGEVAVQEQENAEAAREAAAKRPVVAAPAAGAAPPAQRFSLTDTQLERVLKEVDMPLYFYGMPGHTTEEYAEEDGVWRTINGRRVFIRKGESLDDAMKRELGGKGGEGEGGKGDGGKGDGGKGDDGKELSRAIAQVGHDIAADLNRANLELDNAIERVTDLEILRQKGKKFVGKGGPRVSEELAKWQHKRSEASMVMRAIRDKADNFEKKHGVDVTDAWEAVTGRRFPFKVDTRSEDERRKIRIKD